MMKPEEVFLLLAGIGQALEKWNKQRANPFALFLDAQIQVLLRIAANSIILPAVVRPIVELDLGQVIGFMNLFGDQRILLNRRDMVKRNEAE